MDEQISEQQLTQWEKWGIHSQRELSGLVRAYRAQGEEIERLQRECKEKDTDLGMCKLAVSHERGLRESCESALVARDTKIERLKARGVSESEIAACVEPEKVSGIMYSLHHREYVSRVCNLLLGKGLLIKDLLEPISPTKHRDFMALPIEERRKQMEAQCTDEMVKHYEGVNKEDKPLPPPLGIDKAEVERFVNNVLAVDDYPSVGAVCDWLDGHGLLRDNQLEAKSQLEGVIGVNVGQFAEADPLKVSSNLNPALLAEKHDALVGEAQLHVIALDNHSDRIAALEQRLGQPAEQEAWPKLPDYLSPSVQAEFERIRAVLGVKEE